MEGRRWLGGMWLAGLVLVLVLGSGSIPAGAADWNKDGYDDLAVGVEWEGIGTVEHAGEVSVLYGSSSGISAAGNQSWNEFSAGIGGPGPEEHFGYALAAGDMNGDGAADLAVGIPGEDIVTAIDCGAVQVLYGTAPDGLAATDSQFWHQGLDWVKGAAESGDRFGAALAVGDFDGDGYDDLAVGAPDETVSGEDSAGSVNVLYGTSEGLTVWGNRRWYEDDGSVPGTATASDWFGYALAAGDFDQDGYDDLALSIPGEDLGGKSGAGRVIILYGTSDGLSAAGSESWVQGLDYENYDYFGSSLATGDWNGDGYDDLAIGVPDEDWGAIVNAGAIYVLYGSSGGLTTTGERTWTDADPEAFDQYGRALAAGDFDGDGDDELAVGIPYEDLESVEDTGAVDILYGTSDGLVRRTGDGDDFWHQDRPDMENSAEEGDLFGIALAAGNFDGDNYVDLAVGIRDEDVDGIVDAGAIHILYGSADGISATGNSYWHQDSDGIDGASETDDHYGNALAAFPSSRYRTYLPLVLRN